MSSSGKVVEISRRRLRSTVRDLAQRGGGNRESGAFLLGRISEKPSGGRPWPVAHVAYYDDLDAECLTGGITFRGFEGLWRVCRELKMTVVADVHTHPSDWVEQSRTDSDNPMISTIGHLAVIVPNYAQYTPHPDEFGVHVHLGGRKWESFHGHLDSPLLISSSLRTFWHSLRNRFLRTVAR
jgi:proteasome lid subunit RPN8/RPN11